MLNWIVWNRTVYMYKNGFGNGWYAIKPNQMKLNQTKPNQMKPNQTKWN